MEDTDTVSPSMESTSRLGCLKAGADDIKEHPWFSGEGIDSGPCAERMAWHLLVERKVEAPWVPEISDAMDTSNFEEYDADDEEPIWPFDGDSGWSADF